MAMSRPITQVVVVHPWRIALAAFALPPLSVLVAGLLLMHWGALPAHTSLVGLVFHRLGAAYALELPAMAIVCFALFAVRCYRWWQWMGAGVVVGLLILGLLALSAAPHPRPWGHLLWMVTGAGAALTWGTWAFILGGARRPVGPG